MARRPVKRSRVPKRSMKKSSKSSNSRRRLTGKGLRGGTYINSYTTASGETANIYSAPSPTKLIRRQNWKVRQRVQNTLATTDNITTLPAIKIGVPQKLTFAEKVARINNPPIIYKRNYQWSCECPSGRKAFFSIPVNSLSNALAGGGGLYDDILSNANNNRLTTDTTSADPTVLLTGQTNGQKYYVDYMSQKLSVMNSGTNAITGKITIYGYKRDTDATFTNVNVPLCPINMAMLCSTNGGNVSIAGSNETGLGLYGFDAVTNGVNYTANYFMPGSAQNSGGATAYADLGFKIMSPQIAEQMSYWFKEVGSRSFSLKAGQQFNQSFIFNNLPLIRRESADMTYLKGVSFNIVVEFNGGIVGDSTANNVISTGSAQLSCMLIEKRIVGLYQRLRSKLVMPTAAPAGILAGVQQTINADSGIVDIGYEDDA